MMTQEMPPRRFLIDRRMLMLGGLTIALLVAGFLTSGFLTLDNLIVILRAASITGIVAVGMSFVTLSGNLFALSASSLGAMVAVIFAIVTAQNGVFAGLLVALAGAAIAGAAQGAVISRIGNPIITTLAFGTVFRGLAALLSGNSILRIDSPFAIWLGTARPLGLPTQCWVFVLMTAVGWFIIRKTRIGRELILSGANPLAAEASGLNRNLMTLLACVIFSLGVAVVAVMTVAQFSQAKADLFTGTDFDYIAAILVGGVALRGGVGTPLQAAGGAFLIALLQNLMLLNGFSAGLRMTIVGLLVVATISIFHLMQRAVK